MAEAFGEGLEVDVFDGFEANVFFVEFPSALGLADVDPVGRAVTGAVEAFGVDEGFEQHGFETVAVFPVVGDPSGGVGQNGGGEVSHLHPRENEKAGVVDDEMEIAFSLGGGPADEAVARGDHPCGGAESQRSQQRRFGPPVAVGPDEIAKLRAGQGFVPQVMIALDQFVPQRRVLARANGLQCNFTERSPWKLNGFARFAGGRSLRADPTVSVFVQRRWEANEPVAFHAQHGHATGHVFARAVGPKPAQFITHAPRQLGAIERRLGGDEFADPIDLFGRKVSAAVSMTERRLWG